MLLLVPTFGVCLGLVLDVELHRDRTVVYAATSTEEVVVEPREVLIGVHIDWTPERIKQEYQEAAKRHGVSFDLMWATVMCENRKLDVDIQSEHLYRYSDPARGIVKGEQEQSYGISQIHLPDHPTVTYEQAIDPAFSAEFMAKAFAAGKASWWTCYRKLRY